MAMNVNDTSNTQKIISVKGKNLSSNQSKAVSEQTAPGDRVTITETASNLNQMMESMSEAAVVDIKQVERIKRAIEDGTFKIDALKVAHKLLQFENDL